MLSLVKYLYFSFRSNCISDCYIKEAMHNCSCIPWDYPIPRDTDNKSSKIGICDFYGSSCFNSYIENGMASWCQNECDPGCNEVKFTTVTEKEPIDWKAICSYDPNDTKNILNLFDIETFEYLFNTSYAGKDGITRFQEALTGPEDRKSFLYYYCKEKLINDIAMVEVVMESPTVIRYIQNYKASTTDKLANFGKNFDANVVI